MRASVTALIACIAVTTACRVAERTDRARQPAATEEEMDSVTAPLLGMRSGIYHVADLDAAKSWYASVLETEPYFDEPFYVGFNVGGYELGLNPDTSKVKPGSGGAVPYWGVNDADSLFARLLELGAQEVEPVTDVGGGIRTAIVRDPFGNLFGVIENPHFTGGSAGM